MPSIRLMIVLLFAGVLLVGFSPARAEVVRDALATSTGPEQADDQEDLIHRAAEAALHCKPASAFDALFDLAASGRIDGAHTSEELSEVNEDVFLKCPLEFLLALNAQPEATQHSLVRQYFGNRHALWELGNELRKWKDHPRVGVLVRARFSAYLDAEPPQ